MCPVNRPFPSCCESKAKCKAFHVEKMFSLHVNEVCT